MREAAEKLRQKFNSEKRSKDATQKARGHCEMKMQEHGISQLFIEDDEGNRVRIWVDTKSKIKMAIVEADE